MSLSDLQIFCVQDGSGTAAQLTTGGTVNPVEVGDTGSYTGLDWDGNSVTLPFSVGAVNDQYNFCITSKNATGGNIFLQAPWPSKGTIEWLTGANVGLSPVTTVDARNVANAYITTDDLAKYNNSRGKFVYAASPLDQVEQAIVQATDYIDQRYRFKGVKLFQFLSDNPAFDPSIGFLDPWLAAMGYTGGYGWFGGGPGSNYQSWFANASTFQHTEWPRQGCVDYNGDNVYGVPLAVKAACSELALRALNGVTLQADYDPTIVGQGGVLASFTNEVGPIKVTKTYDTKLGLSFFPDFPQVKRILVNAGLIIAGGGRSIVV